MLVGAGVTFFLMLLFGSISIASFRASARRREKWAPYQRVEGYSIEAASQVDGLVAVTGQVVAREVLRDPLKGRDVVFHETKVNHYKRSTDGGHGSERNLFRATGGEAVFLRDQSGVARVDMTAATPLLHQGKNTEVFSSDELPPSIVELMHQNGVKERGLLSSRDFSVRQQVIEPGWTLTVLGRAQLVDAQEGLGFGGDYRGGNLSLLHFSGDDLTLADCDLASLKQRLTGSIKTGRIVAWVNLVVSLLFLAASVALLLAELA